MNPIFDFSIHSSETNVQRTVPDKGSVSGQRTSAKRNTDTSCRGQTAQMNILVKMTVWTLVAGTSVAVFAMLNNVLCWNNWFT